MSDHPTGDLSIHHICHFSQQNAKKDSTCGSTGKKIAQQAWKIAQTCLRSLRVFPSMLPPSSWIVFVWRQIEWIIQTMGFPIGNLQWSLEAIGVVNGDHTEVHLWITVTCGEYLLNVNLIASFNIVPHVTGLWPFVILQLLQQTFYYFSSVKLIRCL